MAPGGVIYSKHDTKIDKQKVTFLNYALAVFAGIGSFLFGYDSGIISSVISPNYIHFQEYFDHPTPNIRGAIVSVFAGGAFFDAILAGNTANRLGRKRTIQLGALIAAVFCGLQTGAPNMPALIVGRFGAGFSIGVLSMIVPLYQAECSPPHARGLLSGWTQQMISFGFFVANWVGYGSQYLNSNAQWRLPLGIQIAPAVLLGFGMTFLPFSPRWLAMKGRHDEAMSTLMRLHGSRAQREVVEEEYREMVAQIEWEKENVSNKFSDLFSTWPSLHRTLCGVLVQVCCQWTGVNVNSYFGPTIYADLGYTGNTILLITGISGAWGLVCNFVFITWGIDRLGRRPPLIWGAIAMSIFLAWQAGVASLFVDGKNGGSSAGIAGLASIFLFSGAFSVSYGPVSWVYQSEVFSMPLRAMGTSLATASNWLMNVIISQFTPVGLANISWKLFLLFTATNLANAVIAYFLFTETKGLTLEELGLAFGDDKNIMPPGLRDNGASMHSNEEKKRQNGQHLEDVRAPV